ncbi:MAG: hypothetical protein R3C32_09050 [Chloroflexota bacterium]
MQHEVGIRRGTGARFVLSGSHQRDPRSGLLRLFPVRAQQGRALRAAAASQPVRAIRLAARSATRPASGHPPRRHPRRPRPHPLEPAALPPPRGARGRDPMARLTDQGRRRMPSARATSAGGVVLRQGTSGIELVLVGGDASATA